jgi:hypothetical protein
VVTNIPWCDPGFSLLIGVTGAEALDLIVSITAGNDLVLKVGGVANKSFVLDWDVAKVG